MAKKKKRTLMNQKKKKFVSIYNFLIKRSLVVLFDIYAFANINLMGNRERK